MVGPPTSPRRGAGRRRQGEHAYNLVVLVMAITVLNVMVAVALPVTSQQIRRDREEELIFRGLQYAEALRVFQLRYSRQPVRLDELAEDLGKGRSIRQLWPNPMTDNGSWALILTNVPGPNVNPQRNEDSGLDGDDENAPAVPIAEVPQRDEDGELIEPGFGRSGAGADGVQGPISGVFSPEGGEAVKVFLGSNEISEWRFTPDLLTAQGGAPNVENQQQQRSAPPTTGQPPGQQLPPNADDIGRPFPPGLSPQVGGVPGTPGLQPPTSLPNANSPNGEKSEE